MVRRSRDLQNMGKAYGCQVYPKYNSDTEFESDDSVCLGNIEEQFQRLCASEIESSEDSENVVAFRRRRRINRIMTPTAVPSYLVRETNY
ncbi:hypothetical protein WN51_01883 [Melipona quadrifasciata]|uniref:Uncharacterized protein n=1 Tax=Melipona quadrifasciata TaxID=166423 RepID=A0A0M8ZYU0_9HYME|nr:hypothetical protein WN51_01883 [Melipona quadrifasciata]